MLSPGLNARDKRGFILDLDWDGPTKHEACGGGLSTSERQYVFDDIEKHLEP